MIDSDHLDPRSNRLRRPQAHHGLKMRDAFGARRALPLTGRGARLIQHLSAKSFFNSAPQSFSRQPSRHPSPYCLPVTASPRHRAPDPRLPPASALQHPNICSQSRSPSVLLKEGRTLNPRGGKSSGGRGTRRLRSARAASKRQENSGSLAVCLGRLELQHRRQLGCA